MGSLRDGAERGEAKDKVDQEEEEEPILREQNQRFCMFPIRYKQLWEMYKKAEASFWTGNDSFPCDSLSILSNCFFTIQSFSPRKCVIIHAYTHIYIRTSYQEARVFR